MLKRISDWYVSHYRRIMDKEHPESVDHDLEWWRDHIFLKTILILMILASVVIIPSLIMALVSKLVLVFVIDLISYLGITYVFFTLNLNLKFKKLLTFLIFYVLSITLLIKMGFSGPGYAFLLFNSLLATVIIHSRGGYYSAILNTAIALAFILISPLTWLDFAGLPVEVAGAIVITLNFTLVNLLIVFIVSAVLSGLQRTLANDRLNRKKAEESDALKTHFLEIISHELRTPLNSVMGFSSLALEEELEKKTTQMYFSYIHSSGEQLLQVIDGIIDLSLIETGQSPVVMEEFNISVLLDEAEGILHEIPHSNEVQIYADGKPDQNICSDRTRVLQVLLNLLTNALKYTEKGSITFGCRIKDDEVIFDVRDTGIGIPDSAHKEVFRSFYKVSNKSTIRQGAGLGLAISKRLVEMLGGEIWFESALGQGSDFHFSIPIRPAEL